MDFISNLIKRPISLVLNETATGMDTDKTPVSTSLPNTSSSINTTTNNFNEELQKQQLQNQNSQISAAIKNESLNIRPSSISSSFNGNFTDFIGVPDDYIGQFEDILPPPPPLLSAGEFLVSPMENENGITSETNSPPPQLSIPAAMTASQTIDELLSEISDNFTLAGINDEVLAIASPASNAELSPLSSKTALNNSKLLTPSSPTTQSASNSQLHTPKTATTSSSCNSTAAAENASPGIFEANSTLHKFPIDPELETGLFDDNRHVSANELQNTSGVNKSSNKFIGLTEFDEAKIPDLPGDLNPNIEDQYNVTFEECFIPTLTAKQGAAKKSHLLLPNEANISVSSINETFSDCVDDPLADTYLEHPNMCDTTVDGDGYESAVNDITKDGIADVTMELDVNQIQIVDNIESKLQQQTSMDCEDEPMDIDLNATMEIIQKYSDNIQNVERVLNHAENVLEHLEEGNECIPEDDKKQIIQKEIVEARVIGSLAKQTETSKMTFVINAATTAEVAPPSQHLEIEQSNHDVSLNKSIELPVNKSTSSLSSECVITAVNSELPQMDTKTATLNEEHAEMSTDLTIATDLSSNSMSTSTSSSNSRCKSPRPKMNLTINMNVSTGSLKSSAPTSPAFPIKQFQIGQTFPKSPKSMLDYSNKPTFLEKSDYVEKLEQKLKSKRKGLANETNERNIDGDFLEPLPTMQSDRRRTFAVESLSQSDGKDQTQSANNRLTFSVGNADGSPSLGMSFPTKIKTETSRHTFCADDFSDKPSNNNDIAISKDKMEARRTFNISSDEVQSTDMDTSFEPMDIEENLTEFKPLHVTAKTKPTQATSTLNGSSQLSNLVNKQEKLLSQYYPTLEDTTIGGVMGESTPSATLAPMNSSGLPDKETVKDLHTLPTMEDENNSSTLSCMHNKSDSPPLPTINNISDSPLSTVQNRSDSPTLSDMQNISNAPPLPAMQKTANSPLSTTQNRSDSPPLPAMQKRSDLPSLGTMRNRSVSPPFPTMQKRSDPPSIMHIRSNSPPLPTPKQKSVSPALPEMQKKSIISKQQSQKPPTSTEQHQSTPSDTMPAHSPPLPDIQKRPPIHGFGSADILSAKEQSNNEINDEKDEFVEKFTPSPLEDMHTGVSAKSSTLTNTSGFSSFNQSSTASPTVKTEGEPVDCDDEFQGNNNLILNPSDFDYLLTKGNNNTPVDRSSLLLKFDPLLGVPVPSNQGQQQLLHLQIPTTNNLNNNPCLSPTIEEDEHNDSTNRSFIVENASSNVRSSLLCGLGRGAAGSASSLSASAKSLKERSQEVKQQLQQQQNQNPQIKRQLPQLVNRKNATMSVDVIKDMSLDNNDCNKTFEHSNSTQPDDKQINYKMDELEKKIKNEVLKTEDIEKKLKDAEQREEALIKRITEKDKTVAKMTGVIEAYEKAIAELIAEKEQLIQSYEKQLAEVKADRDSNYHHLTSLETTFSDLHVKYEKSKEMTCQLKGNEEALLTENRKNLENLRLQEQRYDKMKNHAMQQLEIANKKLECLTREHSMETTKLKALLKKEEIARSSMSEQLAQKTKENTELVKICDELIQGQGS